jgi:DNA invertase Pin-like site-specific DNA recombinase
MAPLFIGYARVSTDEQDLTGQRDGLTALGVSAERIYVDHGLTGTNRDRPGLREALAACREGDTLMVTKLDRLARSLPDAREILDDLTRRTVKLSLGGRCTTPPTRWGRLRGKQPKLNPRQEAHLVVLHRAGEHSTAELGDLFGVARSTVYRAIQRDQRRQAAMP